MNALPTWLAAVIVIFAIVMAVAWFFLPFAVFGTKEKLDELIKEVRRTNQLLTAEGDGGENPKPDRTI